MKLQISAYVSLAALAFAAGCEAADGNDGAGAGADASWTLSEFVGPSPFHGLHGLAVEADGTVLAGSVVGQAIYAVDPNTGEVTTRIGPPDGMAVRGGYGFFFSKKGAAEALNVRSCKKIQTAAVISRACVCGCKKM